MNCRKRKPKSAAGVDVDVCRKAKAYFVISDSEGGSIEEDVLPVRQFRVKASADLQQRSDPSLDVDFAGPRCGDAGEESKEDLKRWKKRKKV